MDEVVVEYNGNDLDSMASRTIEVASVHWNRKIQEAFGAKEIGYHQIRGQ